MKKIILALSLLVAGSALANAQVLPSNPKYSELKYMYNSKNYVRSSADPYSPTLMGVASFFVPGLGQLLEREGGRGIAFLGADFAMGCVGIVSAFSFMDKIETDANGNLVTDSSGNYVFTDEAGAKRDAAIMVGASLANFIISVWACSDAVKVAKVKNMYYQDQSAYSMDVRMYPSLNLVQGANGYRPAPGLTFAMNF